ncbi:alpha/beta hydrolase [Desertihabitans brevis]|uniref:Alpha/beta hydrolase n=1 Tax=Desertihabitans brevis TaxID=2268447 RepID=A0A367Z2M0_9ACTN|nr:alpha/beta hydrolase [Desertihabitans brevis]RCK71482.1 alpha/beta hydrolase [Desertihabitans brevis]
MNEDTTTGDPAVPRRPGEQDDRPSSGWPPSATSRTVDIGGPVHYLDFAGPAGGPVLVCIHGLGGSALNWGSLAPLLSHLGRVCAVDLVGHGASRSRTRGNAIEDDLRVLETFLAEVCRRPVVLVGHSLGGVLALLLTARRPDLVERLVLLGPPVPRLERGALDLPLALRLLALRIPGVAALVARSLRRLTPEQVVDQQLRDATPHHTRIAPEAVAAAVAETGRRMRGPDWSAAQRSQWQAILGVMGLLVRPAAMARRLAPLRLPVLWLQGEDDPKAPVSTARSWAAARTDWVLRTATDVGHVPHLEDPGWTARTVEEWLG